MSFDTRTCTGLLDENDVAMLKTRVFETLPDDANGYLYIFPTVKEVKKVMVKRIGDPIVTTSAYDFVKETTR